MLILTRKVAESMVNGNNMTLTIMGVKGNHVIIGATAPKEIDVHREEIYNRIAKEQGQKKLTRNWQKYSHPAKHLDL